VAGILADAGFLLVPDGSCYWSLCNGVSAVPFEHAVAGGPAVTGFPILAGGFTYWTVQ
jgi:hypothetical protein